MSNGSHRVYVLDHENQPPAAQQMAECYGGQFGDADFETFSTRSALTGSLDRVRPVTAPGSVPVRHSLLVVGTGTPLQQSDTLLAVDAFLQISRRHCLGVGQMAYTADTPDDAIGVEANLRRAVVYYGFPKSIIQPLVRTKSVALTSPAAQGQRLFRPLAASATAASPAPNRPSARRDPALA